MSLLVRDIIDKSGKDYENLTAIKWLKKKEIQEKTYGEIFVMPATNKVVNEYEMDEQIPGLSEKPYCLDRK